MTQPAPQPLTTMPWQAFWLPWGLVVLAVALACRLLWLMVFQGEVGGDAIRYLWISEHVRQGNWLLLPQLFSSPLLPLAIGLLSHLTGDALSAARIIGVAGNTVAVGLAMGWVRALFPGRPALAWLTGLGLAVNHVWCRLAPFALTENLFYPLLMGFFWLLGRCRHQFTWLSGLALGGCWAGLYFSREIGLYFGGVGFLGLLGNLWWQKRRLHHNIQLRDIVRWSAPTLTILVVMLATWVFWMYSSLGIVSLGEGHRFYSTYTKQFARQSESTYPGFAQGESAFFRLRPYEFMEYTRYPRPDDPRYPKGTGWQIFAEPIILAALVFDNLVWSLKEFQRVSLIGFLFLFCYIPWRLWQGRLLLPPAAVWLYVVNLGFLALTFLGPVREARLIGWFFPWLYLSLAAVVNWLWLKIPAWLPRRSQHRCVRVCLVGLVGFHLLFPQYFKEVPRRWQMRQEPHLHQLAATAILREQGQNAIISSVEAEVAYRAGGYWIGQPNAAAAQLLDWLYLGGADFLLINDRYGVGGGREILWSDPEKIKQAIPELSLLASFEGLKNPTYGQRGRLFRFSPDPQKLAGYRRAYPWAGTHPREAGAAAPPAKNFYEK